MQTYTAGELTVELQELSERTRELTVGTQELSNRMEELTVGVQELTVGTGELTMLIILHCRKVLIMKVL